MTDPKTSWASCEATRRTMQGNRSRDTQPEKLLRKELHARGLRYRVHARPVPGVRRTADIVFGQAKVVVLVHGCFWHGCLRHYVAPATNRDFWASKVIHNRARDAETKRLWSAAGWKVVVVWEHQSVMPAADQIERLVRNRRPTR